MSKQHEEQFGSYILGKRMAMGGMAEIYKARRVDSKTGHEDLVIKRIHPEYSDDPDFVRMFSNESRIASMLSHANIVKMVDYDKVDGTHYIAMELIDGADLKNVFIQSYKQKRPIPLQLAIRIAMEVLKGLGYAHHLRYKGNSLQIVHRDISPHNILLSKTGEVKIADFGIARIVEHVALTASGVLKGKVSYMAPEQTRSSRVDHRADVFSVGVLLWEMLAGQRLFASRNQIATIERIRKGEILPPNVYNLRVPKELSDVVMHALERDLDARMPSAKDFCEQLSFFLDPNEGSQEALADYIQLLFGKQDKSTARLNGWSPSEGKQEVKVVSYSKQQGKGERTVNRRSGSFEGSQERPISSDMLERWDSASFNFREVLHDTGELEQETPKLNLQSVDLAISTVEVNPEEHLKNYLELKKTSKSDSHEELSDQALLEDLLVSTARPKTIKELQPITQEEEPELRTVEVNPADFIQDYLDSQSQDRIAPATIQCDVFEMIPETPAVKKSPKQVVQPEQKAVAPVETKAIDAFDAMALVKEQVAQNPVKKIDTSRFAPSAETVHLDEESDIAVIARNTPRGAKPRNQKTPQHTLEAGLQSFDANQQPNKPVAETKYLRAIELVDISELSPSSLAMVDSVGSKGKALSKKQTLSLGISILGLLGGLFWILLNVTF